MVKCEIHGEQDDHGSGECLTCKLIMKILATKARRGHLGTTEEQVREWYADMERAEKRIKAAFDFDGHGQQMTAPCTIPMVTYYLPDLPGMAVKFKETGEVGVVQSISPCGVCKGTGVVKGKDCTCGAIDPDDGSVHEPGCGEEKCAGCDGTHLWAKVWMLEWSGRTVPVLKRYEGAWDGRWEPLPKEAQEAKPESCLEPKEK